MHIYQQLEDGAIKPRHYTGYAKPRIENGQEVLRPSTLGDFKKWFKKGERVAPSVTSILDIFAKHALTDWKINQHLDSAWDIGVDNHEDKEKWLRRVKDHTERQMDIAPSRGTDFHKDMEEYVKREIKASNEKYDLCFDVASLILEKTGKKMEFWQPEINVFSDLGYAGQCDLFIPRDFDSMDAHSWVIDYKTKQFKTQWYDKNGRKKKLAYPDSHCSQLAAYGMELDKTGSFRAANVFVCLETGEIEWYEWTSEELIKWFEYFQLGLEAWRLKNL